MKARIVQSYHTLHLRTLPLISGAMRRWTAPGATPWHAMDDPGIIPDAIVDAGTRAGAPEVRTDATQDAGMSMESAA
ncbi:hypothetical protein AYM40_10545 [Paraburkholderia phytofirmans OLGA172]|uniref:Uncharacterized protein n=1 Tax=Paraburkholderia phytofirmans OLGA172 TaxID=1417228 RepID=A0A160FK70_9BURK|nr:hypothetical protein AYM40_10545 [Paraburkholderia phytofirmans OLGA172]